MRLVLSLVCVLTLLCSFHLAVRDVAAEFVDFEDLTPATPYSGPGGGAYWNGSDGSGGFTSRGIHFANNQTPWGTWEGWAYSNTTDTTTNHFTNEYSAFAGSGRDSDNYAVFYQPFGDPVPTISNIAPGSLKGAYFTNTTWAALVMLEGDVNNYARQFGPGDWFLLNITGLDEQGQSTGTVPFYLADYRAADPDAHYVIDEWTWVDLTPLGQATQLQFAFFSSDEDPLWGINTPAYFAMDDLQARALPEPSAWVLLGSGLVVGYLVLSRRRQIAR